MNKYCDDCPYKEGCIKEYGDTDKGDNCLAIANGESPPHKTLLPYKPSVVTCGFCKREITKEHEDFVTQIGSLRTVYDERVKSFAHGWCSLFAAWEAFKRTERKESLSVCDTWNFFQGS